MTRKDSSMSTTEPKAGEWWWCEAATMLGALALMRMDSGDWRDRSGLFSGHCVRPLARIPDPPAPEPTEAEKIDARRVHAIKWLLADVDALIVRDVVRAIRASDEAAGYVLVPTSGEGFERMVEPALAMYSGRSVHQTTRDVARDILRAALESLKETGR